MEPAAVRGQSEAAEPHPPAHDVQHGERPALLTQGGTGHSLLSGHFTLQSSVLVSIMRYLLCALVQCYYVSRTVIAIN